MREEMIPIRREIVDILTRILIEAVGTRSSLSTDVNTIIDYVRKRHYEQLVEKEAALRSSFSDPKAFEFIDLLTDLLHSRYDDSKLRAADLYRLLREQNLVKDTVEKTATQRSVVWINHCQQADWVSGSRKYVEKFDRAPANGPFILIMEARSGSSLLVSLLNSHPNIICYPELLVDQPQDIQEDIARIISAGGAPERISPYAQSPQYQPVSAYTKSNLASVGFKTKLWDLRDRAEFKKILSASGYKIIVLTRKNHLRTAISQMNAERLAASRGVYNLRSGIDSLGGKLSVPIPRIHTLLDEIRNSSEAALAYAREYHSAPLVLYYEDLNERLEATTARVLDFLGASTYPLHASFEKATPTDLHDVVENLPELEEELHGTEWEYLLDSD